MDNIQRKEVNEAINAADDAIFYLERARKSVNSASYLGLLDLFGVGTISGLIKHSKRGNAENDIESARYSLR